MFVKQSSEKTDTFKIVSDYPILRNCGVTITYRNKNKLERIMRVQISRMGIKDAIVRYLEEDNSFIISRGGV